MRKRNPAVRRKSSLRKSNGKSPLRVDTPFDRIKHLLGSLDGPGDLSTNPKYMENFGK